MKEGLRPKKHIVIRDLKRGPVKVKLKDGREVNGILQNAVIPEEHMKDMNPNHPLEQDIVHCWDMELIRWNSFRISELETYTPVGSAPRGEVNEERTETTTGEGGVGNHSTETSQGSEEEKTSN